jgi:AcrR family transcriptional regulator
MTPAADAPGTPTLRERKRAEAKANVAQVAIALFAERGFADVSVDEICAAADVAPRSFFRYFPAKADVLLEPVREISAQLEALIAAAPPEHDDETVLRDAYRRLGAYVLDHWERLSQFFHAAADAGAVRLSPLVHLADRERMIAELLRQRRGDRAVADWRQRLVVARTLAAFRVWLDDVRGGAVADPLAHLDAIIAAS